jgi:hypothetical protein
MLDQCGKGENDPPRGPIRKAGRDYSGDLTSKGIGQGTALSRRRWLLELHYRVASRAFQASAQRRSAPFQPLTWGPVMRSVVLLFLGVPIPIILLLAMCSHHF